MKSALESSKRLVPQRRRMGSSMCVSIVVGSISIFGGWGGVIVCCAPGGVGCGSACSGTKTMVSLTLCAVPYIWAPAVPPGLAL